MASGAELALSDHVPSTDALWQLTCDHLPLDSLVRAVQPLRPSYQRLFRLWLGVEGPGGLRSLGEIGSELGVTRERVRQIMVASRPKAGAAQRRPHGARPALNDQESLPPPRP